MSHISLIVSLWLLMPLLPRAQEPSVSRWPVGEKLFFDLSYGWIKGGEGHMEILAGGAEDKGLFHIRAEAHTTGIFALFTPVDDRYETFFHPGDGYPVRAVREVWRGKKRSFEELLFLQDNHRVRSSRSGDHLFPERLYDVLTAFYQARIRLKEDPPAPGQVLLLPLFFDGRFFDLRVKYTGKETISTFQGKQTCYHFVPDTTHNVTFAEEKELQIWVTADERLLPVKITAKIPVGRLRCTLTGIR